MTVYEMCQQAADLSNRGDEFERQDDGTYEDESALWHRVWLSAFNEAYQEAARKLGIPTYDDLVTPEDGGVIDLTTLTNPVAKITRVMNSDKTADVVFKVVSRDSIQVVTDDDVTIRYVYLPDKLESDDDEPDFPDEAVPPELYYFLGVARVFQSENKHKSAGPWLQEYYAKLSKIRHVASGAARRVPVRLFR